jgi:hypothetical protein
MEIKLGTATGRLAGPQAKWILIAVFILVNILLIGVIGIFGAIKWKSIYLQFAGVPGDGLVVDFRSSGGVRPSSAAVIQFNVDGQTYTFDGTYFRPQPNERGDHLDVVYDPNDPTIAMVNTYQERWETLVKIGGGICPSLLLTNLILLFILITRKFSTGKSEIAT